MIIQITKIVSVSCKKKENWKSFYKFRGLHVSLKKSLLHEAFNIFIVTAIVTDQPSEWEKRVKVMVVTRHLFIKWSIFYC